VPHLLSDDQKATRVQCTWSILAILGTQENSSWHKSVTMDKSWFYYMTKDELIWLPPDGRIPDLECVTIQSMKMMFTVVMALKSGCKCKVGYYTNKVLILLSEWCRVCRGGTFQKLMVHADIARPHKAGYLKSSWPRTRWEWRFTWPIHRIWLLLTFLCSVMWKVCWGRIIRDRGRFFIDDSDDSGIRWKVDLELDFSRLDDEVRVMSWDQWWLY
jgi:hypothetical protein